MQLLKKLPATILKSFLLMKLLLVNSSCAQNVDNEKSTASKIKKINTLVELYAEYEMFNGSILVVDQGEIVYKKAFGKANMEWDIPNEIDTKFKIASLTKQFTAMLIMQLVAENKLELHQPISIYLPNYPKEFGNQITIHHLLTHTAGIGNETGEKKYPKAEEMVNQFSSSALKFKPGEGFEYSNSGYTLLGYIMETITGKSYEVLLKEKIFTPLKMKNSGFFRHRTLTPKLAAGYNLNFGEYYNIDNTDEKSAYAAGAIYSTIEDMYLWNQALHNETLLSKNEMDLIFEKHSVDQSTNGFYGYGWEITNKTIGNTTEKIETFGHSGVIDGFRSLYTRIPSRNASIILLNNTNHAFLKAMTTAITGILFDKTYDFPLIPLAKFMVQKIEKNGIDAGIQFYKEHKNLATYYASEQDLIVAGYQFLHAKKVNNALKIFKLSTEMFPDRDNPYDSYAEALMSIGENDEAILNYKKSLELNPNNNNAIKMLKKLGVSYSTDILKTDETWGKELFAIPLHFAKDIKLKGFEDARFPKGWIDLNSPNFWTYAFAWKVDLKKELTVLQIEAYIMKYYDGLLTSVNKEKDLILPKTKVKFTKTKNGTFIGSATIYDTFVTRKPLLLNFKMEQLLCKNNNKSIIVFRISPKKFDDAVWNDLMEIKIQEDVCD